MINFIKKDNLLILEYQPDGPIDWAIQTLMIDDILLLKKTFNFSKDDLYELDIEELAEDEYDGPLEFVLAHLYGEYFKIEGKKLGIDVSVFIHENVPISTKDFIAVRGIPIFKKINKVISEDIYIGGKNPNALPKSEFKRLIRNFPNSYELDKYADARISSVLINYFDSVVDGEKKYNSYMNKKISRVGDNLSHLFKESELIKHNTILEKLERMLESENDYTEKQWQNEILQIILLLYPKYIRAFTEVPIKDTYKNKNRKLDFLLVDSAGNTDVVEIKRPFDNCIVTKNIYRDNYIPLRDLSGTVMQIEKYIFYLNKWGKRGEDALTKRYKKKLPDDFRIKITNPSGMIIMGREKGLSNSQREDFEVIKRKYKNIIDIITYDDLLKRLRFTIEQLKKET